MQKPTVHYTYAHVQQGAGAFVYPVDHPNHISGHDVSNTKAAMTSTVLSLDPFTGWFETKNTFYEPLDSKTILNGEPVPRYLQETPWTAP